MHMGPQMLTVLGVANPAQQLWATGYFGSTPSTREGIMAPSQPIRGQSSMAEFMSQADPQLDRLRSGSTQHLDQDCQPKYLL